MQHQCVYPYIAAYQLLNDRPTEKTGGACNQISVICGVNRVGIDGKGFVYRGDSMIFSPKGKKLADAGKREEVTRTCTLTRADLEDLRGKFPAWKDADTFEIK